MESNSMNYGVVLVTVVSSQEAAKIAQNLLEQKLAACVKIFPVESWYLWQGEINRDREYQLIIKTDLNKFADLEQQIRTLHSYEVPEIVALPLVAGSKPYLNWLKENLKPE
jgi:periplasmic divalent cation tolerance protein